VPWQMYTAWYIQYVEPWQMQTAGSNIRGKTLLMILQWQIHTACYTRYRKMHIVWYIVVTDKWTLLHGNSGLIDAPRWWKSIDRCTLMTIVHWQLHTSYGHNYSLAVVPEMHSGSKDALTFVQSPVNCTLVANFLQRMYTVSKGSSSVS
jgi:hypothetical protein